MNPALLFLVRRSFANGFVARLKRLKNPRYLVPTVLGLAYFILVFGLRGSSRRGGARSLSDDENALRSMLTVEWGVAAGAFAFAALAWLVGSKGPAIQFLESEVAILFPAPVTRRDLVRFKLLDMQKYLLLPFLFFGLMNAVGSGPFRGLVVFLSGWLTLNTITLHQIGARFTRQSLLEHGVGGLRRQAGPLLVLCGLAAAVVLGAPELARRPDGSLDVFATLDALDSSTAGLALVPFRLFALPFLARDPVALLVGFVPVGLLGVLFYMWVLRADVAFEEAAAQHAETLTRRIEAARKGRFPSESGGKLARRRSFWRLSPHGSPEVAFVWKSVTESLRGFSPRLIGILIASVAIGFAFSQKFGSGGSSLLPAAIGCVMLGMAALLVFGGPSFVGTSLRAEMENVETLKSLPISGARLVRSSLLGTVVPTAALQVLLVVGAACILPDPKGGHVTDAWRVAGAAGLALLLPCLAALSASVDSAGVLFFPAWVRPGQAHVQGGVEAMGMGMVVAVGKGLLLLLGSVLPGGIGTAVVAGSVWAAGPAAAPPAVVFAAVAATATFAAELWFASLFLGRRFERLDPAAEGLIQ